MKFITENMPYFYPALPEDLQDKTTISAIIRKCNLFFSSILLAFSGFSPWLQLLSLPLLKNNIYFNYLNDSIFDLIC